MKTIKAKPENRDSSGKFVKGQSGNPGGRKPIPEDLREAFKAKSEEAFKTLVSIANNPDSKDADRIRASEIILDRAWGKPTQAIDLEAKSLPRVVFTSEDKIPD